MPDCCELHRLMIYAHGPGCPAPEIKVKLRKRRKMQLTDDEVSNSTEPVTVIEDEGASVGS